MKDSMLYRVVYNDSPPLKTGWYLQEKDGGGYLLHRFRTKEAAEQALKRGIDALGIRLITRPPKVNPQAVKQEKVCRKRRRLSR